MQAFEQEPDKQARAFFFFFEGTGGALELFFVQ